jgi:ABC-type molybdate transport system substrate-binding protein
LLRPGSPLVRSSRTPQRPAGLSDASSPSRPLAGLLRAAPPSRAAELSVFAAASLTDALREISALYIKEGGDRIVLNLGASSTLARQIQEGAPADLFLSADEEKMNGLEKRKSRSRRATAAMESLFREA